MGELGPTPVLLFELDWYNCETVQTDRVGEERETDRLSEGRGKGRGRQDEGEEEVDAKCETKHISSPSERWRANLNFS